MVFILIRRCTVSRLIAIQSCFTFFKDVDFIVYDELRQYSDLPPYQKLTEEELEAIDFDAIIQKLSTDELKAVIEKFFEYRFECEFQEVDE